MSLTVPLLVLHLLISLALVAVVLLQRSDGGALGIGGGGGGLGGLLAGRGQGNALTRATAILATAFFVTSIVLTLLAEFERRPQSILDTAPPPASDLLPSAPLSGTEETAPPVVTPPAETAPAPAETVPPAASDSPAPAPETPAPARPATP